MELEKIEIDETIELDAERIKLFKRFVTITAVVMVLYTLMHLFLGPRIALVLDSVGLFILIPLTIYLENKNYRIVARFSFILSISFLILLSGFLGGEKSSIEYYYFPASIVSFLIFDSTDLNYMILGSLFPFLAWILGEVFKGWTIAEVVFSEAQIRFLSTVSFSISFLVGIALIALSMRSNFRLQAILSRNGNEKRKKLEALNQKYHEAQLVSRLGSWSYNLVNCFSDWSDQMFLIFGRTQQDGIPNLQEYRALIHPSDREQRDKVNQQCLLDGKPYKVRIRIEAPDGAEVDSSKNYRWIEIRGQGKMDANGHVHSIFGTCQDITDEVGLQMEIVRERAKAIHNEKLAVLGEMAAGVAHEINNPLAVIDGVMRVFGNELEGNDKNSGRVVLIQNSVARISRIVSGLRKFSRSTEKKEVSLCSVTPLVNEVITFVQVKAGRHDVDIKLELESQASFLADGLEIEQVLVNLINNGIDEIKTKAEKWIKIKSKDDGSWIVIQCIDCGSNIPKEIRAKLFNPFFTTKVVGQGTGLGLSISKGIIESYKGTLELLENTPNTCFEIRLPKALE